jgi:SAM-dependent methyltransferase
VADLEALSDLATPWCLRVVATLRVADRLAAGPRGVEELTAAAGCDAESLARVLRHLVGRGVFVETAPGRFGLNEAAGGLRDGAMRRFLDLDGIGGRIAGAWATLPAAVRTGQPAYREAFGRPFWEDLDAHPEVAASFDALMGPAGHGRPDPEILLDGDWASVREVVDVGGGTGALLAEVLRAHPEVRGTLVDLPRTIARAGETFRAAGVTERVRLVGQSFFEPLPAGGDVYTLKNLLADWPDREAGLILSRSAEAARPGGRVVILGGVWPDEDGAAPPELMMMVLVGGRERTLAELGRLAGEAGLAVSAAGRLRSGRFAVECRPLRRNERA